jgi:hypothetical protein
MKIMNRSLPQTVSPPQTSKLQMKTHRLLKLSLFVTVLTTGTASADPSAVGHYGGATAGLVMPTLAAFDSTSRGIIRNLEIVGLQAFSVSMVPGMVTLPAEVRSTNITRRETPQLRLRPNGTFAGTFVLDDPGRLDFQDAEVRVSGRLSGRRGSITFIITMNKTYEDGSSEVAGGEVRVPVRLAQRR